MKQILIITMALVFTLSLAGLSSSGEMPGMNHGNQNCQMSNCGNCCAHKNDTQLKKADQQRKKAIDLQPSESPR